MMMCIGAVRQKPRKSGVKGYGKKGYCISNGIVYDVRKKKVKK